eukprot:5566207-Pyramimonas_sp.AAC.1
MAQSAQSRNSPLNDVPQDLAVDRTPTALDAAPPRSPPTAQSSLASVSHKVMYRRVSASLHMTMPHCSLTFEITGLLRT